MVQCSRKAPQFAARDLSRSCKMVIRRFGKKLETLREALVNHSTRANSLLRGRVVTTFPIEGECRLLVSHLYYAPISI